MATDHAMHEQVDGQLDPAEVGSRIDPVLARSWLLVNGAHADRFEAAARSRADIVVLDIEDAVAPQARASSRILVALATRGRSDPLRISPPPECAHAQKADRYQHQPREDHHPE